MATLGQWVQAARPRTLPIGLAPVAVGTGVAAEADSATWWKALIALTVAVAVQIGVNYANDYSDGIRGTDRDRVGPMRLVGSGAASPSQVKVAAWASLGIGAAAGLALAAVSSWWLLVPGLAVLPAAWFYTGGSKPYGYRAMGEVAVFVFFGPVAVVGTAFAQTGEVGVLAVVASVPVGLLACALLVVNNLRDVPSDTVAGKRTLAVVLGERRTRVLYGMLMLAPFATAAGLVAVTPWTLIVLAALPVAVPGARAVLRGGSGAALVPVLARTGQTALAYGVLLAVALPLPPP